MLEVPAFYDPHVSGDEIPIALRYPGGEVRLLGRTVKETWMTRNHALARGIEPRRKASILAEAFAGLSGMARSATGSASGRSI